MWGWWSLEDYIFTVIHVIRDFIIFYHITSQLSFELLESLLSKSYGILQPSLSVFCLPFKFLLGPSQNAGLGCREISILLEFRTSMHYGFKTWPAYCFLFCYLFLPWKTAILLLPFFLYSSQCSQSYFPNADTVALGFKSELLSQPDRFWNKVQRYAVNQQRYPKSLYFRRDL